jgi:hypothetical protein
VAEGHALVPGLDLRPALRTCARLGHARVPAGVTGTFLEALEEEVGAGPFKPFGESFGPVRQQIDGYDVDLPASAFPLLTSLCRGIRARVRADGRGIRGTATWTPNEVGIAHYVPGSIGITPHMDGKWYRRLVVVATVYGRAAFAICGSRDPDDVVERWIAGPGDLVLMRGPSLAGLSDGRPFHLVHGPLEGERLSLGIRMAGRRDEGDGALKRRASIRTRTR